MSEWQPIETAPKDGTPILAYCGGFVEMIAWFDGWKDGLVTSPSGPCWGYSTGRGDRFPDEGWDTFTGCYATPEYKPTLWQPLPETPE